MKRTDKFLIGIVVGVVLLIVVALVFVMQPSSYLAEDTPEGIVHNYILALQEEDFARAYGYLYTGMSEYPDADKFESDLSKDSSSYRNRSSSTFSIDSSDIKGNQATITVRETKFYEGNILDSGQNTQIYEVSLILEDGEWRIDGADWGFDYFDRCWNNGCG